MRRLALLVALTGVLAGGVARAQSMAVTGTPSAAVEGEGIKLGERMVLHLGIGTQLRYDSNVFYESSNPTQALVLQLTPNFSLSTRPASRDGQPHKIEFRLNGGLTYNEYLAYGGNTANRPPRHR